MGAAVVGGTAAVLALSLFSAVAWVDVTVPPLQTWITLAGGRVWINHDPYLRAGWSIRAALGGPAWGWWLEPIPGGSKAAWGWAVPTWWVLAPLIAGTGIRLVRQSRPEPA